MASSFIDRSLNDIDYTDEIDLINNDAATLKVLIDKASIKAAEFGLKRNHKRLSSVLVHLYTAETWPAKISNLDRLKSFENRCIKKLQGTVLVAVVNCSYNIDSSGTLAWRLST